MMRLWHVVAYVNLGILAADHLITSVAGIFLPRHAAALYQRMFGVRLVLTPEVVAVLKPWGALGVFAGLAGLLPIADPVRYRGILYALLVLLCLRAWIRVTQRRSTQVLFGISRARNWFHVYLIVQSAVIIAAQLIWW